MAHKDKAQYNAYMNEYLKKRYARPRLEAIDRLGGKCVDCGSTDDLEFDHDDRTTKTHQIGRLFTSASNAVLESELAKCVLRCVGCHVIKSNLNGDYRPVR